MHNAANSALGTNPARDRAQPKCATNDREMGSSITLSGGLTIILSKIFAVDLFSEMEARTCLALHGVEAGFGLAVGAGRIAAGVQTRSDRSSPAALTCALSCRPDCKVDLDEPACDERKVLQLSFRF